MFCFNALLTVSLFRRQQLGQTSCQLLLQSLSFTLHSVSSYIRYNLDEILSGTILEFSASFHPFFCCRHTLMMAKRASSLIEEDFSSVKSCSWKYWFVKLFFMIYENLKGRKLKSGLLSFCLWCFVISPWGQWEMPSHNCGQRKVITLEDFKKIVMMYCICLVM